MAFLFGKANVVPLEMSRREEKHHDSIPRLELTAAALGVQVCQMLLDEVGERFSRICFWTDSECVLKQIYDCKMRHKIFVHLRLSKI